MDTNKEVIVQLKNITKTFDDTQILKPTNLNIYEGEFLTFLGPSGCGKTTTLRIIAGLETPTEGSVLLQGQDVTALPPYKRNVNTVFQNYALFPHMNVFDNVAFGLVEKKWDKAAIREKVTEMLELVQLGKMEKRRPSQLSGGQKQRVAIAGVIAMEPEVIVLDEPTAMLDPKGRREVIETVTKLCREKGITVVLITHHMSECTGADRVIVMSNGHIAADGSPESVFSQVELMRNEGLAVPATTELIYELNKRGWSLPLTALGVESCAKEIAKYVRD